MERESIGGTGRILFLSLTAVFVAFLDVTIVNIAFPSIHTSFRHASLPAISWVLNGYNVAFAALLLPAGRYADALGHRRAFVASTVLFVTASAAAAAAPTVASLIAARVVQGAGAAVLVPTSLAMLLDVFPTGRRATAVALWGAAAGLAGASGPAIGGALVAASDWRIVFVVNVPVGLAAVVVAGSLRRTSRAGGEMPDPGGIALLFGLMTFLALGIVEGHDWGWTGPAVIGCFAAALVLGYGLRLYLAARERAAAELASFRSRTIRLANLATLVFGAGLYGMLLNNVLFFTGVWHYSVLTAGLALTPAPLATAMAALPAARLTERFGYRPVAGAGALLYAGGVAYLLGAIGPHPAYVQQFLPAAILTGAGIGSALPSLAAAAVDSLGASRFATGSALNSGARQLGGIIGIAGVVAILSAHSLASVAAHREAWLFVGLAAAASLAVSVRLPRVLPGRELGGAYDGPEVA